MDGPDLRALVERANKLSDRTKQIYLHAVKQWLDFAGADAAAWTPLKAQAFYDHIIANGISVRTANETTLVGLRFAFERAAALYGIANPFRAVDTARVTRSPDEVTQALTPPQAQALLATCASTSLVAQRDRVGLLIALYTGMRRMSLVAVRDDARAPAGTDAIVVLRVPIKGGQEYDVPLDRRVWDLTAAYRAEVAARSAPGYLLRSIKPIVGPHGYTVGDGLTEDGFYKAVKARAATAGVPCHPHVFRHTFVTWCRMHGVEEHLIAIVTGHTLPGMISRVYTDRAQLATQAATRCYEAISARLGSGS